METTASWTKYGGEWAITVPEGATVAPGDTVQVVSKAGAVKTVTVAEQVGSKPWGAIWTLAKEKIEAVPEGYYLADGEVYKVKVSKTGNPYATMLVKVTTASGATKGSWDYKPGAIKSLTKDHAITIEQAAEYGHLHGFCAICGKTLTDPASVQKGIGPVCAKKLAPQGIPTGLDPDTEAQIKSFEAEVAAILAKPKPDNVNEGLWQEHLAELIEAAAP